MPKNVDVVKQGKMSRKELEAGYRRLCEINEELAALNQRVIESNREAKAAFKLLKPSAAALRAIGEGVENGWTIVAWAMEQAQKETGPEKLSSLTESSGLN